MLASWILIVLQIAIVIGAPCEDPYAESCGCIPRATFDLAWLQKNHPSVIANYPTVTFHAPVVSYPDCEQITVTCPEGYRVTELNVASGKIGTNPTLLPNPTSVKVTCFEGEWFLSAMPMPMDDNFKASPLSCSTL